MQVRLRTRGRAIQRTLYGVRGSKHAVCPQTFSSNFIRRDETRRDETTRSFVPACQLHTSYELQENHHVTCHPRLLPCGREKLASWSLSPCLDTNMNMMMV